MHVIIGLLGLLMVIGGAAEGVASTAANGSPDGGIIGAVVFSAGVVTIAIAGLAGHVRRLSRYAREARRASSRL